MLFLSKIWYISCFSKNWRICLGMIFLGIVVDIALYCNWEDVLQTDVYDIPRAMDGTIG